MKIDVLKNMFRKDGQLTVQATITSKISAMTYSLLDDSGSILTANSSVNWTIGERVIVQGGQIISKTGRSSSIKVYTV